MFCPKCATQNSEGASFCRSCGANISLVPQALTGQLPEASPVGFGESLRDARRRRRHSGTPRMDDGIRQLVMGIGFLLVAISVGFGTLYPNAGTRLARSPTCGWTRPRIRGSMRARSW